MDGMVIINAWLFMLNYLDTCLCVVMINYVSGSGTEGGRITTFCPEYKAYLHGSGGSQVGEVTRLGGATCLSI